MKLKLELDEKQINIIVTALYQMPYKDVAELLNTIVNTITEQQEKNQTKGNK
jgi:hypothetical protein